MSKLKIVIITYSWPPRNSISTHRPYSWAKYWSEKGEDVTILTARKQSFDRPLDSELSKLKNVKVIELPYRLFWGPILKISLIEKIGKWLRKKFINYLGPNYNPRNYWFFSSSPVFSRLARESDVVISTYGPEAAHIIGSKMKIISPSIYWIADYRDQWSENPSFESASKNFKEEILNDEKKTVGKYADLITSVSNKICQRLSKLHNKPSFKVTNGFDIEKKVVQKNISKKITKKNKTIKIIYTGSIYSSERSPLMLLEAISNLIEKKKLPENSIVLHFYGSRLDHVKELTEKLKYSNLIKIHGHKPRSKILEEQKKADILLLLASSKFIARGDLTGKIFEYMSAGRPILCIGSRSDFEIGKVLKLTNTGQVFENSEIKKLENLLLETYNGLGLFKSYKPRVNEILKFSQVRIADNFLSKIKKNFFIYKKSLNKKIIKSKKFTKKTPTITHIITGLERGGAERFLFNLLTNGLEGPFKNRVISLMSKGFYGPLLKKYKIPLNCLDLERGQVNLKAARDLIKILKKNPPDIIQGWMYHGNLASLLGKFMVNKKTKLSWNIRLSLEIFLQMKFLTRAAIKLGGLFSKIPDLILYNSVRSINQHRKMGFINKNDYYVPNGFDTNKWKPSENARKKIRSVLKITNNTKVIGYVGRGDQQKDLPNLFKAFELIKKKYSNVILVCVGRNLRKYAKNTDKIIFLDQRADVHDLMKSFDLLCLCSKAEGFPNVIGEAMSSGLPCVATDVGDAKDIVGKTGWVLPPNNSRLLYLSLENALNNPKSVLKKFGKNARTKIVNEYSIKIVKDQYISLYHSILN